MQKVAYGKAIGALGRMGSVFPESGSPASCCQRRVRHLSEWDECPGESGNALKVRSREVGTFAPPRLPEVNAGIMNITGLSDKIGLSEGLAGVQDKIAVDM